MLVACVGGFSFAYLSSSNAQPGYSQAPADADTGSPRRWSRQVAADLVGIVDAVAIGVGAVLPALIYKLGAGVTVG